MGVLIRAAVVALVCAGCYEPQLTDCQVSCAADSACAGDQVCDDGRCVTPEAIGTCGERIVDPDAAADGTAPDARPPDASPPDANAYTLRVVIQGRGRVVIDPLGEQCESEGSEGADCAFAVPVGASQTLLPVETHHNWPFIGWTTEPCAGETATCAVTMDASTLVGAAFGDD